jgi:hypothetical protein
MEESKQYIVFGYWNNHVNCKYTEIGFYPTLEDSIKGIENLEYKYSCQFFVIYKDYIKLNDWRYTWAFPKIIINKKALNLETTRFIPDAMMYCHTNNLETFYFSG